MSGRQAGRREVAYRLFAAEYDDADLEYSDSDEERAPNYVVTPTGARVNRLFVVGVLTEVEPVSDDVLRARVVDPTGAFVVYAGQYQPEAVTFLEGADVPSFVAVTGKARTFQPEEGARVFTSVRPESMTAVDAATRDRWTVQAAEHTLARVATMARALEAEERGDDLAAVLRSSGVEPGLASGVALAIDHYGTTAAYLSAVRRLAVAAAEVVVDDRDEVPPLELDPGDEGPVDADLTAAPAVAGTVTGELQAAGSEEAPPAAGGPAPSAGGEPEAAPSEPTEDAAAEPLEPSTPPESTEGAEATDGPEEAGPTAPEAAEASGEPGAGEPEPAAAGEAEADEEDLGDFEAEDIVADATAESAEEYDMGDAEREQVEAEFGTEFSTGNEVEEPGEADIDVEVEPPSTEAGAPEAVDEGGPEAVDEGEPEAAGAGEPEPAAVDEADAASDEAADAEPEAAVDLEDAAVDAMAELDDGDGADRDAVVAAVLEDTGAGAEAVEAAIQDALMGGRCYEPSDGRLKAI